MGAVQNMSKEMADVRKKVLGKPGVLQGLVQQLRQGKLEEKAQAAELLFCVVGQGPDADAAATKQVSFHLLHVVRMLYRHCALYNTLVFYSV